MKNNPLKPTLMFGRLSDWLRRRGYSDKVIDKVLYHLGNARMVSGSRTLYNDHHETHHIL